MKRNIFLILLLINSAIMNAQVPGWEWATKSTDNGEGVGHSICSDSLGNTYVTGKFEGQLHIGDSVFQSRGFIDIFVAKYNNSGHLIWATHAGGGRINEGKAIALDAAGDVYVTGYFMDTSYFDTFRLISRDSINVVSPGDIFIAKYNSNNGKLKWVKQAGGKYHDESFAIAVDKKYNSLFITGYYASSAPEYSTATFDNIIITSPRDYGIFLAKYDTSGNIIWAKSAGSKLGGMAFGVIVDNNNNSIITGQTSETGSTFFDTVRLHKTIISGYGDMFVAKYDSAGNALWAHWGGGDRVTSGIATETDSIGNVYVTGTMSSPVTKFGSTSLPGISDIDNAFLAKYSPTGSLLWARSICNDKFDYSGGDGLTVDKAGNSYATGYFSYYCSVKPGDSVWSYGSPSDVYVAKFDKDGNGLWATHGGFGSGNSIARDGNDHLYVTGSVGEIAPARFGRNTLGLGTDADMFVAKLSAAVQDGILNPAVQMDGVSIYPNPSSGILYIKSQKAGFTAISISDCLGRVVYEQEYNGLQQSVIIDLPALVTGIYSIIIKGDASSFIKKIALQH